MRGPAVDNKNIPDSRRIFHGSMFVLFSRGMSMAAMVIFSIFMARALGRDVYGLISIAIGIFGIATIIGDMGLNVSSTRYTAVHRKKGEIGEIGSIFIASLGIKAITGTMILIVLYFTAGAFNMLFHKPVAGLIRIMAFAIAVNLPASAFQAVVRGYQRMDLFAGANMARDISWTLASIFLVISGLGVVGAVMGYLVGQVVWLLANAIAFSRLHVPLAFSSLSSGAKKLVTFGLPVIFTDLLIFIYNWSDTFVIGIFRQTWEVSCYNISFGMVNMVMVVITSVSTVMLPMFSEKSVDSTPGQLREMYNRITKVISIVIYPVLTALAVMEPYIIYIYGREYLPGLLSLWILVIWGYFRPYGNMSNTLLTAAAKQKMVLYTTGTMAGLNIVLNLALVPVYGMVGAAIASTSTIVMGTMLSVHFLKKHVGVWADVDIPVKLFLVSVVVVIPFALFMRTLAKFLPVEYSLFWLLSVLIPLLALYWLTFVFTARKLGVIDDTDREHIIKATGSIPFSDRIIRIILPP